MNLHHKYSLFHILKKQNASQLHTPPFNAKITKRETQISDNKFKQKMYKPQKQLSNCEGNQLIPCRKKKKERNERMTGMD